jgi:hypothetical protein
MINVEMQARASQIEDMGLNELHLFKEKISESMLDDKSKYFLFELTDKREVLLNKENSMIEFSEGTDLD